MKRAMAVAPIGTGGLYSGQTREVFCIQDRKWVEGFLLEQPTDPSRASICTSAARKSG